MSFKYRKWGFSFKITPLKLLAGIASLVSGIVYIAIGVDYIQRVGTNSLFILIGGGIILTSLGLVLVNNSIR